MQETNAQMLEDCKRIALANNLALIKQESSLGKKINNYEKQRRISWY